MRSWFVWLTLILISLELSKSTAQAGTLRWQAPPSCPDDKSVEELIESLGAPVELVDSGDFRVSISRIEGDGFAAEIVVPNAGVRHIEGTDCRQVAEAAVLVIAIAHDPLAVAGSFSRLSGESRRETGPARSPSVPGGYLGLEVGADLASLPQLTAGGGLVFGLSLPRGMRVEMAGYAWLPRTSTRGPTSRASAEIGLYSGSLRGCLDLSWGHLLAGPCVAVELGVTKGKGLDVSHPREVSGLWSAGWLGFALRPRTREGFVPAARVELGTPFERPSFEVNGYGQVFRADVWLLRASLAFRRDLF